MPGAQIDKVKGQASGKGYSYPEDWGGRYHRLPVSAVKNQGIDHLLEQFLLVAEVAELRASAQATPRGTVIEAQIEQGRGRPPRLSCATEPLRVGDPFICGIYNGKVKSLLMTWANRSKAPDPHSMQDPGFSGHSNAGDELGDGKRPAAAAALSQERLAALRMHKLAAPQRATLENLFDSPRRRTKTGPSIWCSSVIVHGSVEALSTSLSQIDRARKSTWQSSTQRSAPISESEYSSRGSFECGDRRL
jgi:translation initiation factor IF-2